MNRPARAALAVAGALTVAATLTSCSGENSEYRDAHELRDALSDAGVECDTGSPEEFKEGSWPVAIIGEDVTSTGFTCSAAAVGSPTVQGNVVMGEDANELHTKVLENRPALTEAMALVVGANWTFEAMSITEESYDATISWLEDIAGSVGGRVITHEDPLE